MKGESEINLGLIGLGNIGIVHSEVLRERGNQTGIALKAVADPLPKRIFRGVDHYYNYQELLDREDINAVTISTPPFTHYQIAINSLRAGKHVLVEKPPVLTLEQLEEMARTAKESGVILFTAYHSAYAPVLEHARRELTNKHVRKISISFKEHHDLEDPRDWFLDKAKAGGGALMDSGINAISMVRFVIPSIDLLVTHATLFTPPRSEVETEVGVDFTFEGGKGALEMDWLHRGAEEHDITIGTRLE